VDSSVGVIKTFEEQLAKYAAHHYRFRHQYSEIRMARESLQEGHILLHVDFSENYGEGYGKEVMASHFGANNQIVIHQGILYRKVNDLEFRCSLIMLFYINLVMIILESSTSSFCHPLRH
jgi:hypothetical protein